LPATEVTEEVKNDLEILKMRSALDPKHFYKRSEKKGLPKFFQVNHCHLKICAQKPATNTQFAL
jgi:Fcf2 pre-rRNA processing